MVRRKTNTTHPEKTRKRSLRELFKHVRVGIHEVNSDIDSTLRLLRRLNNHPRPVVIEDRDRLPRPIHLCCHSRKVVLRLGKPHRQCRRSTPFSLSHNYGQNSTSDQVVQLPTANATPPHNTSISSQNGPNIVPVWD